MSKRIALHTPPAHRERPRLRPVVVRQASDYPDVPSPYLKIAQSYANPLWFGPPLCDELIALVRHMFSEEEAELVQHIRSPLGKTAAAVARAAQRPVEEVRPVLDRVADEKCLLLSLGDGRRRRYHLLPLIPGVFELVLVRPSLEGLDGWHRRFAELFAALYDTGFFAVYSEQPVPLIRHLPVAQSIEAQPMALPSDRLEAVLERYDVFAVGLCQCRLAERLLGRGCDSPLENCVAFGSVAEVAIAKGKMRRIGMKDVLTIKAEAEDAGLVTWVLETRVGSLRAGTSCSCCGCCCHALRLIGQFDAPGLFAPPHFAPHLEAGRCVHCGRCALACPMGAIVVDAQSGGYQHLRERCIGCGLCVTACERGALHMEAELPHRELSPGLLSVALRAGPGYLRNVWAAWRGRR
jgi:electron transport complex protein RnfB